MLSKLLKIFYAVIFNKTTLHPFLCAVFTKKLIQQIALLKKYYV